MPTSPETLSFYSNTMMPALTGLGIALGGLFGSLATVAYNRRRLRLDGQKIEIDDSTQLRKDLIEERKAILQQLLNERTFFTDRLNRLEDSSKAKEDELEARIRVLEDENNTKDAKILGQQRKIDEQALQLHAQSELIKVLQDQVKELNGRTECKYNPETCPHNENHS